MPQNILHNRLPHQIETIDSHTGGEPTRVVVSGWPQPVGLDMQSRLEYLCKNQDDLRRAVVCEPRGHDAIVGALLTPPIDPHSIAGVIFFNDVGYLGMCGHALIGTVATLKFMGKISTGRITLDTPAGTVAAELNSEGMISLENVPSYLYREKVEVTVSEWGLIRGDVAYGGNWFFMVESFPIEPQMKNLENLMSASKKIRQALADAGITGPKGEVIDHVEIYGKPNDPRAHSRNFVLCPGNAYDRAPCGTGTSAKMASLYFKNKLKIDEKWIQESITGSIYECHLSKVEGQVIPVIRSTAHVISKSTLFFDHSDPFCNGIPNAE